MNECTVTRAGKGYAVQRRKEFGYQHLAINFKERECEPFLVRVPFKAELIDQPVHCAVHEGQEMDYILSGTMKLVVGAKTFVLKKGDTAYYKSSTPHGMIALDGEDCEFLAIVLKNN